MHNVVNGHHLVVTKRGSQNVIPRKWRCRGCENQFSSTNLDECPDPTVWVQLGTPGDGVGRCRDCNALFVFGRPVTPLHEHTCPQCGSINWFRTDETDVGLQAVIGLDD